MNIIRAVILGLVQGLTEFLPVSSSGHYVLLEKLMGISTNNQQFLVIMLHAGTLISVIIMFWEDWMHILAHPFRSHTLRYLIVASLPALAVVLIDRNDFLDTFFGGWFLGISFLITALLLVICELVGRRGEHVQKRPLGYPQALTMGAMQAVALLPGVSRSGATIFGGIISGTSRRRAAKFSFMMSAPAIFASMLKEGVDVVKNASYVSFDLTMILVGTVVAAVSGYFVIRLMLSFIQKISFFWFAAYVAVLGALVLYFQYAGMFGFPPLALPGM